MTRSKDAKPSVVAGRLEAPAGGGAFSFDRVSIGVFLIDQPEHRIALGGDKRVHRPLKAQEGWILPPGSSGVCEFEVDHQFVAVEIDAPLLHDVGLDASRDWRPRFGALDPLLLQMALSMADPPAGAPTLYRETMRQALAAHLVQVIGPEPEAAAGIDDIRLRRAASHIDDNLASDITLEALAAEAAMSPFHFSRAFKKATGLSPLRFVIERRLERASVLIRTTRLPIAEIAHRVGYEDVSRFGQHFKRRFGATPGSFRR